MRGSQHHSFHRINKINFDLSYGELRNWNKSFAVVVYLMESNKANEETIFYFAECLAAIPYPMKKVKLSDQFLW
jgi:hypothetical protein